MVAPLNPISFQKTTLSFGEHKAIILKNKKSIVMWFISKAKVLQRIKKKIQLPKDWFVKTESYVLITYLVDGRMKFLTLDRSNVAPLLQSFGLITRYEGQGENRKMYGWRVPAGESVEWIETPLSCDDITIHDSDAIHLIACEEYEKIGATLQTRDYATQAQTDYYRKTCKPSY